MNYNKAFNALLKTLTPSKIEEVLPSILLDEVVEDIKKACVTEAIKSPDITFMLTMLEDEMYNYPTTMKNLKMFDRNFGLLDFGDEFYIKLASSLVRRHKLYIDNMPKTNNEGN